MPSYIKVVQNEKAVSKLLEFFVFFDQNTNSF